MRPPFPLVRQRREPQGRTPRCRRVDLRFRSPCSPDARHRCRRSIPVRVLEGVGHAPPRLDSFRRPRGRQLARESRARLHRREARRRRAAGIVRRSPNVPLRQALRARPRAPLALRWCPVRGLGPARRQWPPLSCRRRRRDSRTRQDWRARIPTGQQVVKSPSRKRV